MTGRVVGGGGTRGVLDIEDTHRDLVLASELPQPAGYQPEGSRPAYPGMWTS